ncbi:MAG: hypothetical protein GXP49_00760 [Deltaproteobacteria bacterium]|nr:hypothetical protein [Deltaproteobacteria bacterium]
MPGKAFGNDIDVWKKLQTDLDTLRLPIYKPQFLGVGSLPDGPVRITRAKR